MQKLNEYIDAKTAKEENIIFNKIKENFAKLEAKRVELKRIKENTLNKINEKIQINASVCKHYGIQGNYNDYTYNDIIQGVDQKTDEFNSHQSDYYMIIAILYSHIISDDDTFLYYCQQSLYAGNDKAIPIIIDKFESRNTDVIQFIQQDENKKYKNQIIEIVLSRNAYVLAVFMNAHLNGLK